MNDKPLISYILPVYQAEKFIYGNLSLFNNYITESGLISELIAINDGSTDGTNDMIKKFIREQKDVSSIKYLNLEKNVGKGLAIKKGFAEAKGEYIVFTDCDLQYSFNDIKNLVTALVYSKKKIVIANRMRRDSVYKIRSENLTYIYIRHTAGRVYNWLINLFTNLNIEDTQAGLKGFDRDTAELIFSKMTISGFTFDVDILVCAKENNIEISSIPIEFNYAEEMSTVNFVKQIFIMSLDLFRILLKRILGFYKR